MAFHNKYIVRVYVSKSEHYITVKFFQRAGHCVVYDDYFDIKAPSYMTLKRSEQWAKDLASFIEEAGIRAVPMSAEYVPGTPDYYTQ